MRLEDLYELTVEFDGSAELFVQVGDSILPLDSLCVYTVDHHARELQKRIRGVEKEDAEEAARLKETAHAIEPAILLHAEIGG